MAGTKDLVSVETITAGGRTSPRTITVEAAAEAEAAISASAAANGSVTAYTDTNTGSLTLEPGHGITNGTGDIFWQDSGTNKARRGMTITMTGDVAALDGGSGDDFPALSTEDVRLKKPQSIACVFTGNDVKWALAFAELLPTANDAFIAFLTSAPADIKVYRVKPGRNGTEAWRGTDDGTNPFAGVTGATVTFSHGETDEVVMGALVGHGTPP